MKVSLLAVIGAVTAALAVPVAASAHPMDVRAGSAFAEGMPELSLEMNDAQAGRGWFSGSPPNAYDKTREHAVPRVLVAARAGVRAVQLRPGVPGLARVSGELPGLPDPRRPQPVQPARDHQLPGLPAPVRAGRRGHLRRRADALVGLRVADAPAGDWTAAAQVVPPGTEGLHVFDVRDPAAPDVAKYIPLAVRLAHRDRRAGPAERAADRLQHAVVGRLRRHRRDLDPATRPAAAKYVGFEPAADLIACHDTGVILGDVLRAACAGGEGFAVWSLDPARGRLAHRPEAALHEERQADRGHQHQHRPLGRVLQRRRDADLRPRAERRHEPRCQPTGTLLPSTTVSGADRRHEVVLLLRHRDRGEEGPVDAPARPDGARELHVAQLQRDPDEEARRPRARQLPVGHRRSSTSPTGEPARAGLRRSEADRSERVHDRRRLVVALLQRPDLPVGHHARDARLGVPRQRGPGRALPRRG